MTKRLMMDKTITIGRIYFKLLIPHKQAVECQAFIQALIKLVRKRI